jgi:glycosyltransferase involved in cell wall biosynthesis
MKFRLFILKRRVEAFFIFPFIQAGRIFSWLAPLKKEYDHFYFFPFYHIGGAEKVHAQIALATGNNNCIIFFTRKSHNKGFYETFKQSGCDIKDISKYTGNKWLYFLNLIYRGIITGYINRQQKQPLVFNGQCNFGYKISPWISRGIPQVELIHSLNSFSFIRIPFIPFIHKTIMISKKRIGDHKHLYQRYKIPDYFQDRIIYISNAIELPAEVKKKNDEKLKVLYVGRGTKEKRVHLVAQIAAEIYKIDTDIRFEMLGDVTEAIDPSSYPYIHFYGNQSDESFIRSVYQNAHVLMITSVTEGFPMVVIEAMAYGVAIIATPVGDIPFHVETERSGFLFSTIEDEKEMIQQGKNFILKLRSDPELLNKIQHHNIAYAKAHFNIEQFNASYVQVFQSLKQQ